jgi:hypothetical protein
MSPLDVELAKLAGGQHSVVTRQQALSLGMTARQIDRRVAGRGLILLHQGTYALAGSRPTYTQALMAACLATGGAASHRAAAQLWGLRGVEDAPVEITVPDRRHPRLHGVTVHRSPLAIPAQLTRRSGIPVTKPALTILSLGAVAPELVQGAAEDALFKKLLKVEGLWHIPNEAGAPGRDGTRVLRRLLLARDPAQAPTESMLEDEIVAILRRYGLPEPVRQHRVPRPGRKPLRLDISYPEVLVDVEGDGLRWHTSTADVRRDRERANYLVANGWVILCFTRDDVRHRPAELAAQVQKVRADRLRHAS